MKEPREWGFPERGQKNDERHLPRGAEECTKRGEFPEGNKREATRVIKTLLFICYYYYYYVHRFQRESVYEPISREQSERIEETQSPLP